MAGKKAGTKRGRKKGRGLGKRAVRKKAAGLQVLTGVTPRWELEK